MPTPPSSFVTISCDESGSEGEKLIGGNTEVFAHASVAIDPATARACVAELRRRIRSPAIEYKANHLLRQKHRAVLVWLLGTSGPIYGRARVYLVEKAFLLVRSLVGHIAGGVETVPSRHALVLYRHAPSQVGHATWRAFLESSNQLLWTRNGDVTRPTPAAYAQLLNRMRPALAGGPAGEVLDLMWAARATITASRSGQQAGPPILDPLIPSLVRAVDSWAAGGRRVSITHDEHSLITDSLISELKQTSPALVNVHLVDSMSDARVQVADFLAGVARRIAEEALAGNGDAELASLLRPYVDERSVWGDADSWHILRPPDRGE